MKSKLDEEEVNVGGIIKMEGWMEVTRKDKSRGRWRDKSVHRRMRTQ